MCHQQKAIEIDEEGNETNKTKNEAEKYNIKSSIKLLNDNKSKHFRRIKALNKESTLLEQYGSCLDKVRLPMK